MIFPVLSFVCLCYDCDHVYDCVCCQFAVCKFAACLHNTRIIAVPILMGFLLNCILYQTDTGITLNHEMISFSELVKGGGILVLFLTVFNFLLFLRISEN